MLYKSFLRPLLFLKDPEQTHEQTLSLLSRIGFLEGAFERLFVVSDRRLQVRLGSLKFSNPVGLAAGFDKNAKALKIWPGFGFGFIEIGTITARPQPGNPKPRLFRLPKDQALINRLGFNNQGAESISTGLQWLQKRGELPKIPLGINIGRSAVVETRNALQDYLFAFERLYLFGDYFTLNVSSPNTPGLRELQEKGHLMELLGGIQTKNRELARQLGTKEKSILVKVAPDLGFSQVDEILEALQSHKAGGIIATNTTALLREGLVSGIDEPGGLSGRPLREKATSFIRYIYSATQGRLPIIGSGGVFTAQDAYEKIRAGATAVQIYTGFVYEGPGAVKRINHGLLKLLDRDGFRDISEAVGAGSRQTA
jgi:dihydroorotate dehydrogenase